MLKFDLKAERGLARVGVIHTPHGNIETPAFIGAATKATVKALTFSEMDALGSQAILANTYHLLLAPGIELIEKAGGLQAFAHYEHPTFTDSGGFQIFSLPDVKISETGAKFRSYLSGAEFTMTPESSMQAQWQIGADIHMAFDQLAKSENYEDMKEAMQRTHQWLERCVAEHQKLAAAAKQDKTYRSCDPINELVEMANEQFLGHSEKYYKYPEQSLFAVVQGGDFLDLRAESARFCAGQPVDGFGIGGIFTAQGMDKMLNTVNQILPD